jgi:hypothetical protein
MYQVMLTHSLAAVRSGAAGLGVALRQLLYQRQQPRRSKRRTPCVLVTKFRVPVVSHYSGSVCDPSNCRG